MTSHLKRELLVFRQRATQLQVALDKISYTLRKEGAECDLDGLLEEYAMISKQLLLLEADFNRDSSQISRFLLQPIVSDFDCSLLGVKIPPNISKEIYAKRIAQKEEADPRKLTRNVDTLTVMFSILF